MRRARASIASWLGPSERLVRVCIAALRSYWWRWWRRRRRPVPIVYQLDAVECGTACLAMILAHLGHARALAAARRVCDPGRDGLTLDELISGARALGLEAQMCVPQPFDNLRTLPLPAIVHWRRNHFVVLERIRRDELVVIDPARGRHTVSKTEFEGAAGPLVTVVPTTGFDSGTSGPPAQGLWFLADLVRTAGAGRSLILLAGYSFALQLIGLITPVLTQILIDRVIPGRSVTPLTWLAVAIIAVVSSQALLRYVRTAALAHLQAELDTTLMTRFVSHLFDLPLRFFQRRSAGDLLMRLAANSNVRELITGQSLAVVFDGLFVTGYLLLLLAWSPLFAAIALMLGLLQASVLLTTRASLKDVTDRQLAAQAETHGTLVEALHGIASLKALGAEPLVVARWSELFRRQTDISVRRQLLAGVFESGLTALRLFSTLAFLWCGAREVLVGHVTLGTMLGLNALAAGFLLPIGTLVGNLQQFHLLRTQLERILDVLDAQPEQTRDRREPPRITGAITFDRVSFRYQAGAPLVLKNVSFTIDPGQCVAIVGRTGSGKSTLAALLLGLHEPTQGTVLIDGTPLATFDYRAVRRQCGVVFQDSLVFAGSMHDNIAFGRTDIGLEAIVRAATLAQIHDDISRLPMGYDTPLLDGGSGLSAGQRQRLLLARALVHQPALLVLDEATSHLDTDAERRLVRTIMALPCTRLVITHRLAAIQDADLVIVLEGGRIVEAGTPAELLSHDGLFAAWSAVGTCWSPRGMEMHDDGSPDRGFVITDRGG